MSFKADTTLQNSLPNIVQDETLVDGLARYQGVDTRYSFIVQAPAGSGKTSLLTQRYLALLAQVDTPEHIVAMTFTKKAAAEMRERVIEALVSAQKPLPKQASVVQQNNHALARRALLRDQGLDWQLLANPNQLRIKTIDGMNSFLVAQMPWLSKMGVSSRIVNDATPLYQEAVRQVFKLPELSDEVGQLLQLVNGRFARAENLLVAMLQKRDQWMGSLLHYQHETARVLLQDAMAEIIRKQFDAHRTTLKPLFSLFAQLCDSADFAVQNEQPQLAILQQAWPFKADLSALQAWQALLDWVLTKDGKVRKKANKNQGFPPGGGEAKEQKQAFEAQLAELAEHTGAQPELLAAMQALQALPEPTYTDTQWHNLQSLIRLLKMSVAVLRTVFQQQGEADYIEMAQAAKQALGEELEPTDLAQQLDYQIQHLLVDEFQDTSREQFRMLYQLVAGWEQGDGRTLFLVGDPMQSIYRFREAEVGNFLQAWKGQLGPVCLQRLQLEVNFRSTAPVVNWVNKIFAQIFPSHNNTEQGAVQYSASKALESLTLQDNNDSLANSTTSGVYTHWALNQSADVEAQEIVAVIQTRLQAFRETQTLPGAKKVAVLGRSRSSLVAVAQQLAQQGIAFRAVDLENLYERQEVQDVFALSRAFLHLGDKAAWIALLRSPLVGLNLKDLTVLNARSPYQPLWQTLQSFKTDTNDWDLTASELSAEAQQRLKNALPVLAEALQSLGPVPLAQCVLASWWRLDGPQSVANASRLANVEVFCDMLSQAETLDLNYLETQMQRLFARPDTSKSSEFIELMTMHKSKGLEFDTVILPGLGRKPRADNASLVSWFQYLSDNGQEQLVIAPLDQKGRAPSKLRELLKSFEKQKQQYELGRLLYVAATRAKYQLHCFAQMEYTPTEKELSQDTVVLKPHHGSLLASLWPSVAEHFEALAVHVDPPEEIPEAEALVPKISRLPLMRQGFADLNRPPLFTAPKSKNSQSADETDTKHAGLLEDGSHKRLPEEGTAVHNRALKDAQKNQPKGITGVVDQAQSSLVNTCVGTLVHAILEQMVAETLTAWNSERLTERLPAYRFWLQQQGIADAALEAALYSVQRNIDNALSHAKVRWALSPLYNDSQTELALTSWQQDQVAHHVVDRTFVDESGVRWIIDYKTSAPAITERPQSEQEAFVDEQIALYRPQLERYGELFAALEQRPQKWVLYFCTLNHWQELNSES